MTDSGREIDSGRRRYGMRMPALLIVLLIVGVVLLVFGIAVQAVKWLIIIAVILILLAIIGWLLRTIRGRSS